MLITKSQDNGLRAVFCSGLCSKYFALKNNSAICIHICTQCLNYGLKEEKTKKIEL